VFDARRHWRRVVFPPHARDCLSGRAVFFGELTLYRLPAFPVACSYRIFVLDSAATPFNCSRRTEKCDWRPLPPDQRNNPCLGIQPLRALAAGVPMYWSCPAFVDRSYRGRSILMTAWAEAAGLAGTGQQVIVPALIAVDTLQYQVCPA
jgi:hypothetical protein